jgi:hypothetical protein
VHVMIDMFTCDQSSITTLRTHADRWYYSKHCCTVLLKILYLVVAAIAALTATTAVAVIVAALCSIARDSCTQRSQQCVNS